MRLHFSSKPYHKPNRLELSYDPLPFSAENAKKPPFHQYRVLPLHFCRQRHVHRPKNYQSQISVARAPPSIDGLPSGIPLFLRVLHAQAISIDIVMVPPRSVGAFLRNAGFLTMRKIFSPRNVAIVGAMQPDPGGTILLFLIGHPVSSRWSLASSRTNGATWLPHGSGTKSSLLPLKPALSPNKQTFLLQRTDTTAFFSSGRRGRYTFPARKVPPHFV